MTNLSLTNVGSVYINGLIAGYYVLLKKHGVL